jgi:hypothetical protein
MGNVCAKNELWPRSSSYLEKLIVGEQTVELAEFARKVYCEVEVEFLSFLNKAVEGGQMLRNRRFLVAEKNFDIHLNRSWVVSETLVWLYQNTQGHIQENRNFLLKEQ